jgi:hypothetical protein
VHDVGFRAGQRQHHHLVRVGASEQHRRARALQDQAAVRGAAKSSERAAVPAASATFRYLPAPRFLPGPATVPTCRLRSAAAAGIGNRVGTPAASSSLRLGRWSGAAQPRPSASPGRRDLKPASACWNRRSFLFGHRHPFGREPGFRFLRAERTAGKQHVQWQNGANDRMATPVHAGARSGAACNQDTAKGRRSSRAVRSGRRMRAART